MSDLVSGETGTLGTWVEPKRVRTLPQPAGSVRRRSAAGWASWRVACLGGLAWLGLAEAWGQNFTFEGGSVAGGGGTARGGDQEAMVTVGEPWSGMSSSERYEGDFGFGVVETSLETGPWPTLEFARTNDRLTLGWEAGEARFILQESVDPVSGPWSDVRSVPVWAEAQWNVEVPMAGARFFRLVAAPPVLAVEARATSVLLTWVSLDASFVVQEARVGLMESAWTDRATAVRPVGGRWVLDVPKGPGPSFFRLRHR